MTPTERAIEEAVNEIRKFRRTQWEDTFLTEAKVVITAAVAKACEPLRVACIDATADINDALYSYVRGAGGESYLKAARKRLQAAINQEQPCETNTNENTAERIDTQKPSQ